MTRRIFTSGLQSPLLAFELRLALLKKRSDAFRFVLARKAEREQINLSAQSFVERGARGGLHGLLRHAKRYWTFLGDAICEFESFRFEVFGGDDYIDEAEAVSRLRVDHVARQYQL